MSFVYTGCFTTPARGARGRGIGIYADGPAWAAAGAVSGLTNPSYLLTHPALPVLYAAHGDEGYVSVFAIDPATGGLTPRGQAATAGGNGVHIALSPDATRLLVLLTSALGMIRARTGETFRALRLGPPADRHRPPSPTSCRRARAFSRPIWRMVRPSSASPKAAAPSCISAASRSSSRSKP